MGDLRIGEIYPQNMMHNIQYVRKVMCGEEQVWPHQEYAFGLVTISAFKYKTSEIVPYARISMNNRREYDIEYFIGEGYISVTPYSDGTYFIKVGDMPYENMDIYDIRTDSILLFDENPARTGFVFDSTKISPERQTAMVTYGYRPRGKHSEFMIQAYKDNATEYVRVVCTLYDNGEIEIKDSAGGGEELFSWTVTGRKAHIRLDYDFGETFVFRDKVVNDTYGLIDSLDSDNKGVTINLDKLTTSTYDVTVESITWFWKIQSTAIVLNYQENFYMKSGTKWGASFHLTIDRNGNVISGGTEGYRISTDSSAVYVNFAPPSGYTVISYNSNEVPGLHMTGAYTFKLYKASMNGQTVNAQVTANQS